MGGRTTQFARTIATLQGVVSGLYPGTPATTRILTARYSTPHWASHGAQLRDAWLRGIELERWRQDRAYSSALNCVLHGCLLLCARVNQLCQESGPLAMNGDLN